MPMRNHRCFLLSLLVLSACCAPLRAQVLVSDDHLRVIPSLIRPLPFSEEATGARSQGPDTLDFAAQPVFFDDFSQAALLPDSSKWYLGGSNHYPLRSEHMAVAPPSRGVMTFDGANSEGQAYELRSLASGTADVLRSHCLDLSSFGVSDNLYLSFYLQPQGLGNQPDNRAPSNVDEFRVYFANNSAPGDQQNNLQEVFSITGSAVKPFRQYIIPLNDPAFFHPGFYVQFEISGSLNGYLDHWHLDYVYLAPNRSRGDTTYHDVSVLYLASSPLAPYTAIPYRQYQQGSFMQPFQVWVSNLGSQVTSAALAATLSDPVGQTPFPTGNLLASALNLPPRTQTNIDFGNAFSDQLIEQDAAFQVDLEIESGDPVGINDRLRQRFRLDSLFAYDDGEADASFGLNKTRGFGVRYDLQQPDTLVAIWVNFVPTVNCQTTDCNSIRYMENEAFRLTLWSDDHPDSTQYRQIAGSRVRYGDSLNHFERFVLDIPQAVSGTFWVGLQQLTELPIGVGFDLNYANNEYMFWDSSGVWTELKLNGTLMIRPELQNGRNLSTGLDAPLGRSVAVRTFPNPTRGSVVRMSYAHPEGIRRHHVSLWNLQGQRWLMQMLSPRAASVQLELPPSLPAGVYLLRHRLEMYDGQEQVFTEKLLIQP